MDRTIGGYSVHKKLVFILLLCFVCISGYTTNYEVVVNDTISEKIELNIFQDDKEKSNSPAMSFITTNQYALINQEENAIYDKQLEELSGRTKVNLTYNYSYKQFKNAKYLNTCFDATTYINKTNYLYFRGYNGFYCLSQKELRIKVTTDKLVMKHNADIVEDNSYIWKVTEENASDFEMEIQISNNKEEKPASEIKIMGIFKIIIGIIIGIAIVIIYITIRREQKRTYM